MTSFRRRSLCSFTARNKGTCDNLLGIRREALEHKVLEGLKTQLMHHPEMVTLFIEEFHREVNRQRASRDDRHCRIAIWRRPSVRFAG